MLAVSRDPQKTSDYETKISLKKNELSRRSVGVGRKGKKNAAVCSKDRNRNRKNGADRPGMQKSFRERTKGRESVWEKEQPNGKITRSN